MSTDRARQKKLEKHKKKRAEARRDRASAAPPTTLAGLVREAVTKPFGPAWVAASIHDVDAAVPELVHVVITRRLAADVLLAEVVLVDRTCLGVKNAFVMQPKSEAELEALIAELSTRQPMVPCDTLFALSVLFHALDYARALGFSPHRDFVPSMLGARPEALLDTPLAKRPRPQYLAGVDDDDRAILARLTAAVGAEGFDYFVEDEGAVDFAGMGGGESEGEGEDADGAESPA